MMQSGIETSIKDEQFLKAWGSIDLIDEGMTNFFNDEHPHKNDSSISPMSDGIVISARDEQLMKAYRPIFLTFEGIFIVASDVHSLKV